MTKRSSNRMVIQQAVFCRRFIDHRNIFVLHFSLFLKAPIPAYFPRCFCLSNAPFRSIGVVGFNWKPDELCLAPVGLGRQLDQRVQGHLDVGQVSEFLIQEVAQNASKDSLVSHEENVALALQLHHDRLQSRNQVLIALSTGVSVRQLILVPRLELFWVTF